MNCDMFEQMTSAYLDEELSAQEAIAYQSHLSNCLMCGRYLAEIRQASRSLRGLSVSDVPRELHGYVMSAVAGRVSGEVDVTRRLYEWLLKMNPLPLSYAAGAIVSIILFAFVLSGVKPIPLPRNDNRLNDISALMTVPPINGSTAEFYRYNDIQTKPPLQGNEEYYELPRVLNTGSMVSFSNLAYQKPGNEGLAALVEVESDGRARLVEVIDQPKDSSVVEQLWWSLTNPTFQPALIDGHPVPTKIVFLVEKMDVGG